MGASSGVMPDAPRHVPVMLADVLDALQPKDHETYIDGTFGAGGYTRAILEAADCRVLAFDRDPGAIAGAAELAHRSGSRLTLLHRPFGDMAEVAVEAGVREVDGVVLDIGVSSMQLDEAERGFSFQSDGPLDMRMSCEGASAADVLNSFSEEQIADIIYEFGEERRSRAIARAIVKARAVTPLSRTKELADLVLRVFHGRREEGRHPATRTFQALRIFVNDELGELQRGLGAAEKILKPGGRLVVVTFHSLEDRIVKQFLAERSGKVDQGSRHLPQKNMQVSPASFRIVNSRPLTPQKGELDLNPRARSARLRAAVRTEAPAWGTSGPSR
jgi:16S rRNA (cytosine1402-N4)-methyltransferase